MFEAISSSEEINCGRLVSLRGVSPATVSHHLKILAEAGLVETGRVGQFIYYKAIPKTVEEYTHALRTHVGKEKKQSEWI